MGLAMEQRYVVVSHINKGAFASVSLALDTTCNNKHVALKRINPAKYHAGRSQKEAWIHGLFSSHPNVATLFNAGTYGDTYAMAMELGGQDLLDSIVPDVGLGEEKAIAYMADVLSALEFMHGNGYVHRDIKPENIALMRDGNVCLLDFGHASHVNEVGPGNARIGTAQYLAPEGVAGQPVDPAKMDIFSAGVCVFAIATGRFPWISASPRDQEYSAWLEGKSGPKNKGYWMALTPRMHRLLWGMLEVDPRKRWSAAQACEYIRLTSSYVYPQGTESSPSAQAMFARGMITNLPPTAGLTGANLFEEKSKGEVVKGQAPLYCCV